MCCAFLVVENVFYREGGIREINSLCPMMMCRLRAAQSMYCHSLSISIQNTNTQTRIFTFAPDRLPRPSFLQTAGGGVGQERSASEFRR
jgi:hypothetical protein